MSEPLYAARLREQEAARAEVRPVDAARHVKWGRIREAVLARIASHPNESNKAIAVRCGCSADYVKRIRSAARRER